MLHSISDLTTFCRKTTGDVPPKLVGASTTVVGSRMYLFGGRLVTERRMVSDLYMFDLDKLHWSRISLGQDEGAPRARYFHSADAWNGHLVIFGGMSNKLDSINPDDLCVLDDVRLFDLTSNRWLPSAATNSQLSAKPDELSGQEHHGTQIPHARYAHLSSITGDRLFIIGGQDYYNVWLDDVCVYDLQTKLWVMRQDYPRHCGTYRSVAVSSTMCVHTPQEDARQRISAALGPSGTRFMADSTGQPAQSATPSDDLTHLPYSVPATSENPSDIYLYSNYNFTDVKRELEVFSPEPLTPSNPSPSFAINDCSDSMKGSSLPPGLRFPTGAVLGNHFIVAGTYLAHTYQSFSIWALDLTSMTWSRIDPGSAMATGSWARGCLYAEANRFLVFGNRNGNLVDDYTRRLLSWDHVAVVDLEAFGIYQPPRLQVELSMQELGLAALEEAVTTDFEIVCDDGRKIACSRRVLEARWPWFREQRRRFVQVAMQTIEQMPPQHAAAFTNTPLPSLPGSPIDNEERPDPRLTPRALQLSEPYPITLALLQYFYSQALLTPLQHAPAVLSELLILSATYKLKHLQSLVKHAMHRALSNSTSVGVYEVATLCSCRSLQIRALKTVMSYSQKRPAKVRSDNNQSGDRSDGGEPGRPSRQTPDPSASMTSRPRGTSDAYWRGPSAGSGGNALNGGGRGYQHGNMDITEAVASLWLSNEPEDDDENSDLPSTSSVHSMPHHPVITSASPSPASSPSLTPSPTNARFGHHRSHSRKASVSTIVEDELCAVAELMSPEIQSAGPSSPISFANKTLWRAASKDSLSVREARSRPPPVPMPPIPVSPTHLSYASFNSYSWSQLESDLEHNSPSSDESSSQRDPHHSVSSFASSLQRRSSNTFSTSSSMGSGSTSPGVAVLPITPISYAHPQTVVELVEPVVQGHEERFDVYGQPLGHPGYEDTLYSEPPSMPDHSHMWPQEQQLPPAMSSRKVPQPLDLGASSFSQSSSYLPEPPQTPATPATSSEDWRNGARSPTGSTLLQSAASTGTAFSKIFGGGKKEKGEKTATTPSYLAKVSPGGPEYSPMDPKQAKEEAKRRKKAEAKIRTQRLADDLKRRRQAAGETNSTHSSEDRNRGEPKEMSQIHYKTNFSLLGV